MKSNKIPLCTIDVAFLSADSCRLMYALLTRIDCGGGLSASETFEDLNALRHALKDILDGLPSRPGPREWPRVTQ